MKLMHIAGGGDKGGAKTHILALCSRLKENNDLTLVSLRSGEFADDAQAQGIKTKTFFTRNIPMDYVRLIREAKRQKPDIVHCHGAKANLAGVLIKLFTGATIVTTVHSDYRLDYMHSFLKRNTIGRMNALALRFFDYYVTVSDNFKRMLIERGFSPQKMMTIYNGLDFSEKAEKPDRKTYLKERAGLDYEEGDVVLGIPARLNPVKDISTLLRAFALAQKTVPNLKLIIGGDGEEMDKLTSLSRELRIDKSVSFMGWLRDVPTFFAACDIDVLCSISESFPYSILEGIREGCAVITSDVGGMRDLIESGESGYIFKPGDYETFASYIVDLALDPDKRRRFADKLYDKASRMYSLDSMAATQQGIYQNILTLEQRKKDRDGVLICGAYGRGNAGDEAILQAILDTMRAIDPLTPLCVMTRKPKQTELKHKVKAVYTFNIFKFLRQMRSARLFINGGGNLIQDVTSTRSLFFYLFTIWAAHRRGCRVLMYGCGIGHVKRGLNKRIAGSILNRNVDIITLRDPESLRELDEMGVTQPDIRMSADPTLCLTAADDERACELMLQRGLDPNGKYICFALRSWKGFSDISPFTEAAKYAYEKYGLTAVFIPFEQPADIPSCQRAAEGLETPHLLLTGIRDVELLLAVLKRMTAVCAMRLHALVFSAAADVPFIGVSYDVKVKGFMEYAGNPGVTDLRRLDAGWLKSAIDKVMLDPHALDQVVERLRTLERRNSEAARELLEQPRRQ